MKSPSPSKRDAGEVKARVRGYLASLPPDARRVLGVIRRTIRSVAPSAVETFSYGIPGFRFQGQILIWYAAWKRHTSLYPLTVAMRRAHAAELKRYETSKGTIRFPLAEPMPVAFVRRLVKTRLAELREKRRSGDS